MGRTLLYALLACGFSGAAPGQDADADAGTWPPIREIAFDGNDTTQPDVLLREMVVRVGDPADPERIEASRQAIQDLRLFRAVGVEQEPSGDGVRLVVTLRERYFVLPLPRATANSDGQYSYGVAMRWWNVMGLNHTLHVVAEQGSRQEAGRGDLLQLRASYDVPFLFDTPYGLGLSASHTEEAGAGLAPYDEVTDTARLELSRALGGGAASQGWRVGGGLQWQRQDRSGIYAPPAAGHASALVLFGGYNGMHDDTYSEHGTRFSIEGQGTVGALGSDYEYEQVVASFERSWRLGDQPHRTLGFFAEGGTYAGGFRDALPAFSLGGADRLRGYPLNRARGDGYGYAGLEVLQPLRWDWLRAVAFVEAGDVEGDGIDPGAGPYADVGIGLRFRLSWFVHTELTLGIAVPLADAGEGRAARPFATGHR